MDKLPKEQINHIAMLARIGLKDSEKKGLEVDIEAILTYVDKLKAVDTSQIEPIGHISGLENQIREDNPEANEAVEEKAKILASMAPNKKDGYVKSKQVLTK